MEVQTNEWRGWYGMLMQNYRSILHFEAQRRGKYDDELKAKQEELRWGGHSIPKGKKAASILNMKHVPETVFTLSKGAQYVVAQDGSWRKQ